MNSRFNKNVLNFINYFYLEKLKIKEKISIIDK
jgi:hypothetical protein